MSLSLYVSTMFKLFLFLSIIIIIYYSISSVCELKKIIILSYIYIISALHIRSTIYIYIINYCKISQITASVTYFNSINVELQQS